MFLQFLRSILAGCRKRIYYRQCHDVNGYPLAFRRFQIRPRRKTALSQEPEFEQEETKGAEDLPTLDRPIKANSGRDSSGHESRSGALQSKMADEMFTIGNQQTTVAASPLH
jgi:hypothetical protein